MTYIGKQKCKKCNKEMVVRTVNRMFCDSCQKIARNDYKKQWLKRPENKEKHKVSVKNWQLNNKERIEINRRNNPNFKIVQKRWRSKNKDVGRRKQERYRLNNPLKVRAHSLSQNIEKNPYCEICKSTGNLEKHHWRYDKPLLVNTLCKECHTIQHTKKRRNLL